MKIKLKNKIAGSLIALFVGCSPLQKNVHTNEFTAEDYSNNLKQEEYNAGDSLKSSISLETLADEHSIYYSREDSLRVVTDSLRAIFEIYVDLVRTKENKIEVNDVRFGEILFTYYRDGELSETNIPRETKQYTKKQREFFERYEPIVSRIRHSFRYTTYSDGTMHERIYTIPVGHNVRTKEYKGKKRVGIDYRNFKND